MPSRLIIGTGYLGKRLARAWLSQGDTVFAVTRSPERASVLAAEGFSPLVADVTQPETLSRLPSVDTLVYCAAYDRKSHDSPFSVYVAGLGNVLQTAAGKSACIVHISSTGVYGDQAGDWTYECSPTRPLRPSAKALLEAEDLLRSSSAGPRSIVLRLAGIYGPGRIPLLENLRRATPLPGAADAVINLIHVDDAVTAVLLANDKAARPNLFNVSDGHPVTRAAFYSELARILSLRGPQAEHPIQNVGSGVPESGPGVAANRGMGHKRVSNDKICRELGFSCRYPTYREGLLSIVQHEFGGDGTGDRV